MVIGVVKGMSRSGELGVLAAPFRRPILSRYAASLCPSQAAISGRPTVTERQAVSTKESVVVAVVLAAGAARRFGAPKQRVLLEPVLERVRASSVDGVLVVLGAYEVETSAPTVRCEEWQRGPGASLRCGLSALAPEAQAAIVVLADGPDLSPRAVDRVIERWRHDGVPVLAASYRGQRSHPVLLAREAWDAIPEEGARALEARLVPCDDLGEPGDVDHPWQLPERFGSASMVDRET